MFKLQYPLLGDNSQIKEMEKIKYHKSYIKKVNKRYTGNGRTNRKQNRLFLFYEEVCLEIDHCLIQLEATGTA